MRRKWTGYLFGIILVTLMGTVVAADSTAEGKEIGSLQVVGNVTQSRAEILSVVRSRPGNVFNGEIVAEDIRRIGALNPVKSAYYNTEIQADKVLLTYVVEEHNLVRAILFEGNKKLKDRTLTKELSFKKGDYLDVYAARAGIEPLKEKYKKKGYPWVEIVLDEGGLITGQVIYKVTEGPRPKVAKVTYEGNDTFSPGRLNKTIKTKTRKLFFFPVYFDPVQFDQDTEMLLEVYQKQSFLDASVSSYVEFNEDKSKAYVTFTIKEGPAYLVDSIHFTGNEQILTEELQSELKLQPNYFYSEAWAESDVKKIKSKYGEKGYIEAAVNVRREFLPDARVRVAFEIEEGVPYRIGEVIITGNETFQDRTIRRIMDEENFTPGELYNADIARGDGEGELERTIKETVVAESIIIQPTGDDPETRDAQVSLKEGQTGSVMVGAGIASDDGLIGQISLTQRNFDITDTPDKFSDIFSGNAFRGAGQQFKIVASPGTEYSTYLVSFTEPYLYDKPISFNMTGSYFERSRETYDEERLTGRFGLQKRYPDKWRRGLSFRAENVKITDLDWDAPDDVRDVQGDNMLFGIRPYIQKDMTDSRFMPTKGYNFDFGYEQVVGDHNFGLLEGTYRWYKTLWEDLSELKTVLETKVKAGTSIGDAPTFERYYLGGTGQWGVRGFEYRGISPRGGPSDEPIGSDWAMLGSAEIAVPLGSETFSLLFFSDAGMIDDGGPRISVGTGIQIKIPQFFGPVPMRFEIAAPLMDEDEDETQAFSFSVGALF